MSQTPEWMKPTPESAAFPPEIDMTVAHSARMYDWWLGGKDNFPADRELGRAFLEVIPNMKEMARANRDFVSRAVRYLAREAQLSQFLDIGTGIPTSPNVHEIAQGIEPASRVLYLDNDPIVLAHARALMTSSPEGRTAYIHADVREPEQILSSPELQKVLDLDQPVGLMMVAVLMLLHDEEDPWGKTRTIMDALPSGSYMALTHPSADFDPEAVARAVEAATQAQVTLVPRERSAVQRFFGDWELVEPGLVPVMAWRPDEEPENPNATYYWAGIARKP
ncbi:SAM-dependent methyltransferase [Salinactinospora qingdaonensis]|uniref:SAM-dependent methyltransferase n=1 Tax=Salinactinospora qingdaonensis TaxID=702744 RepID=A0ABP7GLI9_9ACTN